MTKKDLINLIDSLRIDSMLEHNTDLDSDELGAILGILGVEDFKFLTEDN